MDAEKLVAALFLFALSLLLGVHAIRYMHRMSGWFFPLYLGCLALLGMAILLIMQANGMLAER